MSWDAAMKKAQENPDVTVHTERLHPVKPQAQVTVDTQAQAIRLTLPWPPSANRYWRNVKGRTLKSREARAYAKACQADAIMQMHGAPLTEDVAVTMHLYRPTRRGDLDNRIKVALDALQGIAFDDDKQVVEIHAYRHDDKNEPRLEVEVRRA
jgi:Holliday junction resolvase RusA-like endonuclease